MTILLQILALFCWGSGFVLLGFFIGRSTHKTPPSIPKAEEADKNLDVYLKKWQSDGDVINHEGVGIVMRPTAEEINKMNEPEQVKESKAAVAETLRHTPTIDL